MSKERRRQKPDGTEPVWSPIERRTLTPRRVRLARPVGESVHFAPIENGLDYLVSVIDHLAQHSTLRDPALLKYAVLHLAAGTEVLLKARLELEHWSLVFANVDEATPEKLQDGTLKSCSPEVTRRRLKQIAGIDIPVHATNGLSRLADARNSLTHYGLIGEKAKRENVEQLTAQVLHFLIGFLNTHLFPYLDDDDHGHAVHTMESIRYGLTRIDSYAKERLRNLAPVLGPHRARSVQCYACMQWSLVVYKREDLGLEMFEFANVYCVLCEFAVGPERAARLYEIGVLKRDMPRGVETRREACPACDGRALVRGAFTVAAGDRPVDFCFDCGASASAASADR
ncbi:hypothetical protein [Streptomyces sp. NPDC099088]|uniref:hypothetical protein n=1 Tax=Streptomyces sp. NPDC099088 TaxID=3366101 RepID=UPI00382F1694